MFDLFFFEGLDAHVSITIAPVYGRPPTPQNRPQCRRTSKNSMKKKTTKEIKKRCFGFHPPMALIGFALAMKYLNSDRCSPFFFPSLSLSLSGTFFFVAIVSYLGFPFFRLFSAHRRPAGRYPLTPIRLVWPARATPSRVYLRGE